MIFKFQQGGTTPPYVAYQPVIVSDKRTSAIPEEAAAAKVASDADKGKLTSKDLYTMLKEKLKGLPSDVDVAMWKLQSVEESLNLDFFMISHLIQKQVLKCFTNYESTFIQQGIV